MPAAKKAKPSARSSKAKPVARKSVQPKKATPSARAMPKFDKSSPEMVALFERVTAGLPMIEPRKMFGYPAAFVNGQMFASLFQDHFILRLPTAEREAFISAHGAHVFEPMPGRPMREYVEVPPALLKSGRELDDWLAKGLAYAQSLPPKAAKPRRK